MKIRDMIFGPERTSEADLQSIIDKSDARLGQHSTLTYSPSDNGQVVVNDLRKGAELGIPAIPDAGFEPQPVTGGTKTPW